MHCEFLNAEGEAYATFARLVDSGEGGEICAVIGIIETGYSENLTAYLKPGNYAAFSGGIDRVLYFDIDSADDEFILYVDCASHDLVLHEATDADDEIFARPWILADSSDRAYSPDDVGNLTDFALLIARSELYARHGCIFENAFLDDYFRRREWYEPTTAMADVELTETERGNFETLLAVERERESPFLDDEYVSSLTPGALWPTLRGEDVANSKDATAGQVYLEGTIVRQEREELLPEGDAAIPAYVVYWLDCPHHVRRVGRPSRRVDVPHLTPESVVARFLVR